jgi:ribosomal subunit interface protein
MNITYTGQSALTPAQLKKFEAKLEKIGKMLDRDGDKSAHVIIATVRHLTRVEITINYYSRTAVVNASDSDVQQAAFSALDKLEKQILKQRDKWRDVNRRPAAKTMRTPVIPPAVEAPAPVAKPKSKTAVKVKALPSSDSKAGRIYRVNNHGNRKPMTVDEALLELSDGQHYVVFRDAGTDRTNVLVKRDDGHFDLIEG